MAGFDAAAEGWAGGGPVHDVHPERQIGFGEILFDRAKHGERQRSVRENRKIEIRGRPRLTAGARAEDPGAGMSKVPLEDLPDDGQLLCRQVSHAVASFLRRPIKAPARGHVPARQGQNDALAEGMLKLVIGNKNYSSWSLRPWLLLRHIGAPFTEIRVPLYQADSKPELLRYSPSGKVPALIHEQRVVWDSLAICEYLAELFPDYPVWPKDSGNRALARSVAAEMHSSFSALRHELPMNCRFPRSGVTPSADARADIERIVRLWQDSLSRSGGPWLFGSFSAADAMYAPVVIRFAAYGVSLSGAAAHYVDTVLADPPMQDWIAAGRAETESLPEMERGRI